MQNNRSRLETRLARLVGATTPVAVPGPARRSRIDVVFLAEADQERLETRLSS